MIESLELVLPAVAIFAIGAFLRQSGFARAEDGQLLLRLVFFVALPALVIRTLLGADIEARRFLLPVICIGLSLACLGAAWILGRRLRLDPPTFGALVVGSAVLNTAFVLPFITAVHGDEGLLDLILFDLGNTFMVTMVAYPLSFRLGGHDQSLMAAARRAAGAPMTWAMILGVVLSQVDVTPPQVVARFLDMMSGLVGPMILLGLGIVFRPSRDDIGLVSLAVALRMGLGLAVGAALASLLGLTGSTWAVVAVSAASPIGFTALAFSGMAGLDTEVSARSISASLLAGVVAMPLLLSVLVPA